MGIRKYMQLRTRVTSVWYPLNSDHKTRDNRKFVLQKDTIFMLSYTLGDFLITFEISTDE